MKARYISLGDIDDNPVNSDWTKSTWDIPARTKLQLLKYLDEHGITVEHFITLPVYYLNVDKIPWLDSIIDDTPKHVLKV